MAKHTRNRPTPYPYMLRTRLPAKTGQAVKRYAKRHKITVSEAVRRLIKLALNL